MLHTDRFEKISPSDEQALFDHPKNITIGHGRIIYAEEVVGGPIPSGWVLPGGKRTQDRDFAVQTATWIDFYTRRYRAARLKPLNTR